MLSRETFAQRFGKKAIFGMVHLHALPGAPLFKGSLDEVVKAAVRDAWAIGEGGADGLVIENFGDKPFFATRVPPETIAAMTRVVSEINRVFTKPFGVNVLRNDGHAALAIAAATGASFIRVNVLTGAMVTDQGVIEADAAQILRTRERIAPNVAIFADHLVKHAVPLAPYDPVQMAKDLRLRGLADAVITTGAETGAAADPDRLRMLRESIDAPILIGSGLTAENAASFADADGAIVGTSVKGENGAVDAKRVAALVRALKK